MGRASGLSVMAAGVLLACGSALAGGGTNSYVSFSEGNEGWVLNGWDVPSPTGGNPGAHLHWDNFVDTFGMEARTDSNSAFIGDYTQKGEVTISLDYKVNFISFFGTPVPRDLVLILRDYDTFNGFDPASVWIHLGTLDGNGMDWTHFSADVTDVFSETLPGAWRGAGAEDPNTFEPILPVGRTWTNVLQGVDEIAFTTFVPGFFYGFTNFNVSIDNVNIAPVPSPAGISAIGLMGAVTVIRRRR